MKIFGKILMISAVVCLLLSSLSLYSCVESQTPAVKWHYGEDEPSDTLSANVGDFYFEFGDCDVHTYTDDGWKFAFNMKGSNGKNGVDGADGSANWFSGEGKPSAKDGRDGDFWMNTKNLTVYEKNGNTWSYKTRITNEKIYDYANDSDGRLKILCIGNSYSKDTTHHVPEILHDVGIHNFDLGHLYIANCSVQRHYANLTREKIPEFELQNYQYRLNDGNGWTSRSDFAMKDAIESENWDFIVIQHKSKGLLLTYDDHTKTYLNEVEYYAKLIDEVKKYCPDATFVWNMTWSGSQEYTKNNQLQNYTAITANTAEYYAADGRVSFFNPIGTAIQNARSSYLGDTMNRDGAHLSYSVGCYTAGLTFVGSITGVDISDVTWRPMGASDAVSEAEQRVAIESAVNALKTPLDVTESKYKTKP